VSDFPLYETLPDPKSKIPRLTDVQSLITAMVSTLDLVDAGFLVRDTHSGTTTVIYEDVQPPYPTTPLYSSGPDLQNFVLAHEYLALSSSL
jgi:hypothetical protein